MGTRQDELYQYMALAKAEYEDRIAPATKELADLASAVDPLLKLTRLLHTMEDPRFVRPPKWVLELYQPAVEVAIAEIERLRTIVNTGKTV